MPKTVLQSRQPTCDPGWPALLRPDQAAAYVSMSRRWVEQQVAAGVFPRPIKLGRATLFRREDIDAWIVERADDAK